MGTSPGIWVGVQQVQKAWGRGEGGNSSDIFILRLITVSGAGESKKVAT